MKRVFCIILLIIGFKGFGQSSPAAAFHLVDSLFHGRERQLEVAELDFPPAILQILVKFNQAVSVNRDWFAEYSRTHAVGGQPLPYDEKFGLTRQEYDKIKSIDKVHPALKVVDSIPVKFVREGGVIRMQGDGVARILGYLSFDVVAKALTFAGDTIPLLRVVNPTFMTAFGVVYGHTWRLEKTDVKSTLQSNQLTARVVEIDLGIHEGNGKPLIRIQYQDVVDGVNRANFDLTGFLR